MNSQHQFTQATPKTQHSHPHGGGSRHSGGHSVGKLMGLLGIAQLIAHNSQWMSDYRTTKLVPASKKVVTGSIVVLVLSVVLWRILPTNINGVALGLAIVAAAHLALLVAGGLSVSLFIRHQRTLSRQMVIESIPWKGNEAILDVGCGTGMLLNGCAQKLTTGKAVGVDLWQESIAGTPEVLLANAKAEGVATKIEYKAMDARQLMFDDASFNVVVSSFALHHIGTQREDCERAIGQMVRVLAPGGYLSLIDVGSMIDIAESVIAKSGLQVVSVKKTRLFHHVTARQV